jgi:hypothetical protein
VHVPCNAREKYGQHEARAGVIYSVACGMHKQRVYKQQRVGMKRCKCMVCCKRCSKRSLLLDKAVPKQLAITVRLYWQMKKQVKLPDKK